MLHPNMTKAEIEAALTELKQRVAKGRDLRTAALTSAANAKQNIEAIDKELEALGVNPADLDGEIERIMQELSKHANAVAKLLPAEAVKE